MHGVWSVFCVLLLLQAADAFSLSSSPNQASQLLQGAFMIGTHQCCKELRSNTEWEASNRPRASSTESNMLNSMRRRSFLASSFASVGLLPAEAVSVPRVFEREVRMTIDDGSGNPRSKGFLLKRFTGDSTPFTFQCNPVRLVREWPDEMPFASEDFSRLDESNDAGFYSVPRFVYHIDEGAVAALTQYYRKSISPRSAILDICSSWVSHYPLEFTEKMSRISGTGMNFFELSANEQLSDFKDKNLNIDPTLPYDDATFDVVTCVVSIDYLVKPIQVLKEVNRVLKPGGKVIISQSNRCFPTKAIKMWLEMNDRQHLELINGYIKYAGGFKCAQAFDISARGEGAYDPMFIVEAEKA